MTLIFGTNIDVINDVKHMLSSNFVMKDLSPIDVILGIKILQKDGDIMLMQSHYVEKLLKKFNYSDVKPVLMPFDPSIELKKNLGEGISSHKYSQIIGSLLHLTNFSRPDIAYAVGRLGKYTHNPDHSHWTALERVFKYLKGTINYEFIIQNFLLLLKDIVMQIGFLILMKQSQPLVMFLLWVEVQYHGNLLNNLLFHDLPWK